MYLPFVPLSHFFPRGFALRATLFFKLAPGGPYGVLTGETLFCVDDVRTDRFQF